jgi:hypothetical protein
VLEQFLAEITRNCNRRAVLKSLAELRAAIMEHPENHNAKPKPLS